MPETRENNKRTKDKLCNGNVTIIIKNILHIQGVRKITNSKKQQNNVL